MATKAKQKAVNVGAAFAAQEFKGAGGTKPKAKHVGNPEPASTRNVMHIDTGDKPLTKQDLEVFIKQFKEATMPPLLELSRNDIERIASVLKPAAMPDRSQIGRVDGTNSSEDEASDVRYDFNTKSKAVSPDSSLSPVAQEQQDLHSEIILTSGKLQQLIAALEPVLPISDVQSDDKAESAADSNLWNSSPVPQISAIRNCRREINGIKDRINYLLKHIAI